ncbi:MAG TPA: hypothetical protein VF088_05495 [Pyrinomonadaceae bacterium]
MIRRNWIISLAGSISKSTYIVFVVVVIVMVLSVTVFKGQSRSLAVKQNTGARRNIKRYEDRKDRYPVVDLDEPEPNDPVKREKLKQQRKRFDKDSPFTNPGPEDAEVAFRPEFPFDFPALPVAKSDVVIIGQVLSAEAHRSENKTNIFSNFEVRVEEVLKGNDLSVGNVINIQREGGFLKYSNGRKVLVRLSANGMPAVAGRYAFFLRTVEEDYSILTGYEFTKDGIVPLDYSPQFQSLQGEDEPTFLKQLRDAISEAVPNRRKDV